MKRVELEHEGDTFDSHCHNFDHVHILAVGEVDLYIEGEGVERYKAPANILVPKKQEHSMVAVSDYTLGFCVKALRKKGEIVDPDDMPDKMAMATWVNTDLTEM